MKKGIAILLTILANQVNANSGGSIWGYSGHPSDGATCSSCHYNGAETASNCGSSSVGSFNYSGSITTNSSIARGNTQSITYSMTKLSGTSISKGGMGARIDAGVFADTGGGTVIVRNTNIEATHVSGSNTPSSGNISWTWNWTAPTAPGSYKLYVCGNPTNGDSDCANDGPHTNTCKNTTITVTNTSPSASNDGTMGSPFITVSEDDASFTVTGNVLSNDTDADIAFGGDSISYKSFSTSAFTTKGSVIYNNNGTFSYKPNGQFESLSNGSSSIDRFQYTIEDDQGATSSAVVFVKVTGVNDAPTIAVTAIDFSEDNGNSVGDVAANYTVNDAENDSLTVTFTSASNSNGYYSLDTVNKQVKITSAGLAVINSGGALDAINLTVTDNGAGNLTGTSSDTPVVTAVNDAPTISVTANNFTEDSGNSVGDVAGTYTIGDEENNTLTVTFSSGTNSNGYYTLDTINKSVKISSTGLAAINAGTALDTINLTVTDNGVPNKTGTSSDTPTLTLVNDAPTITVTANDFTEDSGNNVGDVAATYTTNDEENDTLSVAFNGSSNSNGYYSLDTANKQVKITSAGLSVINTGAALDSIVLTVTDNGLPNKTSTSSDTPQVLAVSDPPTFDQVAQSKTILEDATASITYSATDVDNDDALIEWSVSTPASHGSVQIVGASSSTLVGSSATFIYTPTLNYNTDGVSADSFSVKAVSAGDSIFVSSQITVTSVNDAPVISEGSAIAISISEDSNPIPFNLMLHATDVENDTLTWSISSAASHGTASVSGSGTSKSIAYVPNTNYNGNDSFVVQVSDGALTDTITVSVTISAVNDPPVITQGSVINVTMDEDSSPTAFNLTLNASDIENDTITWSISSAAGHGTASASGTGVAKAISYVPTNNYNGNDSFVVQVEAGALTDTITVNVAINAKNDAPALGVVTDQSVQESQLLSVDVGAVFSDVDASDVNDGGGSITWTIDSGLQTGMAISNKGVFTWTPPQTANFNDEYNVVIKASDGLEDAAVAASTSFKITVNPPDSDSDTVPDYNDFCPTIADSTNADNDGDGTAGTDTDPTDSIGGDVCDSDDDNDGMPDSYEITNQFDPKDASDASLDFDKDGISNLDEFLAGSNPLLGVLTIPSTGYYTAYTITPPEPSIIHSDATSVELDNKGPYRPGKYELTWTASNNAQENLATSKQTFFVQPMVNFNANQQVSEGGKVTLSASLNGDAALYPVLVPYTISGTSDSLDHDAVDGTLSISKSTNLASVEFNIAQDSISDDNETLIVTMGTPTHAVKGQQVIQIFTIKEGNLPPSIDIKFTQNGKQITKAFSANGVIQVTAQVTDANSSQTHSFDWSLTSNSLVPPSDLSTSTWSITPSEGIYEIALTVTDSGVPSLSSSMKKVLVISAATPPALSTSDTDGDGIDDQTEGYGDSDGDGIEDYLDNLDVSYFQADRADASNAFVLETQNGLQLKIGNTGLASDTAGTVLTDNEIKKYGGPSGSAVSNSVDTYEHIGGIYDFLISGLTPGNSAYVVIPLQVAIPKNAIYRKYNAATGWSEFATDGIKNQIFSAKGSLGACPAAKSTEYKLGLRYLDNCIQLQIEDGGLNDQDGVVNGQILDPGAISIKVSKPTDEIVRKGGAISLGMLVLLGLLLIRRARMT